MLLVLKCVQTTNKNVYQNLNVFPKEDKFKIMNICTKNFTKRYYKKIVKKNQGIYISIKICIYPIIFWLFLTSTSTERSSRSSVRSS